MGFEINKKIFYFTIEKEKISPGFSDFCSDNVFAHTLFLQSYQFSLRFLEFNLDIKFLFVSILVNAA